VMQASPGAFWAKIIQLDVVLSRDSHPVKVLILRCRSFSYHLTLTWPLAAL